MDEIFHGLHFCYVYIDDVLIASSIPEEHLHHSWLVLNDHGILINVSKSLLGHAEFKKPKRYCDSSLGNVLKCDCMVCAVQRIPMTPISLSSWSSLMRYQHTHDAWPHESKSGISYVRSDIVLYSHTAGRHCMFSHMLTLSGLFIKFLSSSEDCHHNTIWLV